MIRRWRGLVAAGAVVLTTVAVVSPLVHASPVAGPRVAVQLSAGRTLVIAHRGASASAPENTLPAMRLAAAEGADMVEFDVQRTSDGHLIVVHDLTFARTTDVATVFPGRQNDPIGSFTLAEVEKLDAGSWMSPRFAGTRIPTLRQLIDTMRPTRTKLLLELKNPRYYPGYEAQVARLLRATGVTAAHRVWVHSFDPAALARFHQEAPRVPVGLILNKGLGDPSAETWLTTVNTTTATVSDAKVDAAGSNGLLVLAWPKSATQDTATQIERLVDDGVTGVITNRPALARREIVAAP